MVATLSKFYAADETLGIPAVVIQVICWINSYMVFAATTDETPHDDQAIARLVEQTKITRDWACAMVTPKVTVPRVGTTLMRTTQTAIALPMSQRLAQRFKKQIFVSIDIQPFHSTMGQESQVALQVEKKILGLLKELIKPDTLDKART